MSVSNVKDEQHPIPLGNGRWASYDEPWHPSANFWNTDRGKAVQSGSGGGWNAANGTSASGKPLTYGDWQWFSQNYGPGWKPNTKTDGSDDGGGGGGTGPSYSQQRADQEADRIRIRNENALGQEEVTQRGREKAQARINNLLKGTKAILDTYTSKKKGATSDYNLSKSLANNTLKAAKTMWTGNTTENKEDWRYGANQGKQAAGTSFSTASNMLNQFGAGNSAVSELAQNAVDIYNTSEGENNQKFGTAQRGYDVDYNTAKQQRNIDLGTASNKYMGVLTDLKGDKYKDIKDIYDKASETYDQYGVGDKVKKDKDGNIVLDQYGVVQYDKDIDNPYIKKSNALKAPNYNWKRNQNMGKAPIVKPKTVSSYQRKENVGISKESTTSKY